MLHPKAWSGAEERKLRRYYEKLNGRRLLKFFPGRTLSGLHQKARHMGMRRRDYWSVHEISTMRLLYPSAEQATIETALPDRSWGSIIKKAGDLGIRRHLAATRNNKRFVHPIVRLLRKEREQRKLTRPEVGAMCGYHVNQIQAWEMGKVRPWFVHIVDWAAALGFELVLRPQVNPVLSEEIPYPARRKLMAGKA